MGDCRRNCKNVGEIAVMEVGHGRVTRRAMEVSSPGSFKRRKIDSNFHLVNQRCMVNSPEKSVSLASSENSYHGPALQCSSNDSSKFDDESLRSVDLKTEGFETQNSTFINGSFSRETTPTSELCADSDEELESSTSKQSSAGLTRKPAAANMPSTAEIEEFFSVAEKSDQKQFADKYNYDILKDVPLKGRYQWVRLKP